MAEDNSRQSLDHYDYINAPQYVDFEDFAAQDDPNADKFFETHREEDDFMIPLDTISPTVQLLFDNEGDTEHYSNQANQAAKNAGLEDVKIEYYSSPKNTATLSQPSSANKKSINSMYGTPLGGSSSGMSSGVSFYTPTGGEDKENSNQSPYSISVQKSLVPPGKDPQLCVGPESGNQRGILTERLDGAGVMSQSTGISQANALKKKPGDTGGQIIQTLASQLDQLCIVSSDEEEETQGFPDQHKSSFNLGAVIDNTNFSTLSAKKKEFFGLHAPETTNEVESILGISGVGANPNDNGDGEEDTTLTFRNTSPEFQLERKDDNGGKTESDSEHEDRTSPIELGSPVRNILKKLDSIDLDDENPHVDEAAGVRCSILVAPSVGQQVYWGDAERTAWTSTISAHKQQIFPTSEINKSELQAESWPPNFADGDSDNEINPLNISSTSTVLCSNRRASSVGDLVRAVQVEPKMRSFKTYGFNPRLGITIPKTPEVAERMESVGSNAAEPTVGNACYFEIEAPKRQTALRRVSSCSELHSFHEKAKKVAAKPKPIYKKPLTVPKTPEAAKRGFRSSAKTKLPSVGSSSNSKVTVQQAAVQRNGPCTSDRFGNTATSRSRQPMKANHYVSMAEAMIKFQKNTPDRFRSLPKGRMVPEKRSTSCDARKRGQPSPCASPPDLARAVRSRTNSFSEKKDSNHKTASKTGGNGPILPRKVELKPTIPQPFNFGTTHRAKAIPVKEEVEFKFKARPVPQRSVMDNTTLAKSKMPSKVTQPMSPHFASDDRLRERHQKQAKAALKSPESKQGKNLTLPKYSKSGGVSTVGSNKLHVDEHKTTVVQPFSSNFDERQKEVLRRKEEKIKHVAHELDEANKGRGFHANPVPKYSSKLPRKKSAEATNVEPFQLKSDARGAAYQETFRKKIEEEEQQLKEQAMFVAQPADVIHKMPFEPDRPTRMIEVLDVKLATEKRAAEREVFEEQIREKSREEEERKKEEQEMLEEAQRKEDIERRRHLVHKAQPFKDPKPFALKSSGKPLTVPQSPAFAALPSERRVNKPSSP